MQITSGSIKMQREFVASQLNMKCRVSSAEVTATHNKRLIVNYFYVGFVSFLKVRVSSASFLLQELSAAHQLPLFSGLDLTNNGAVVAATNRG